MFLSYLLFVDPTIRVNSAELRRPFPSAHEISQGVLQTVAGITYLHLLSFIPSEISPNAVTQHPRMAAYDSLSAKPDTAHVAKVDVMSDNDTSESSDESSDDSEMI